MISPRPRAAAGADPRPAPSAIRVLVVDDQRDEVLTLTALLRDEGYETRGVYHARDVVELIRTFEPHAVLLDIGMPDLNGYDAARLIRNEFGKSGPLLVAVTGWNKSSDRMLAGMAGFDHHVAKPYEPRALLALLKPLTA